MDKTEKIVTDFMKETMPFTYKANNDGRLMTNLANFYDWLELKKQLPIHGVIASAEFEKDLEKAIEEGNEVGYNADGGYNYYCEGTALREVLKVIKKHLL